MSEDHETKIAQLEEDLTFAEHCIKGLQINSVFMFKEILALKDRRVCTDCLVLYMKNIGLLDEDIPEILAAINVADDFDEMMATHEGHC